MVKQNKICGRNQENNTFLVCSHEKQRENLALAPPVDAVLPSWYHHKQARLKLKMTSVIFLHTKIKAKNATAKKGKAGIAIHYCGNILHAERSYLTDADTNHWRACLNHSCDYKRQEKGTDELLVCVLVLLLELPFITMNPEAKTTCTSLSVRP